MQPGLLRVPHSARHGRSHSLLGACSNGPAGPSSPRYPPKLSSYRRAGGLSADVIPAAVIRKRTIVAETPPPQYAMIGRDRSKRAATHARNALDAMKWPVEGSTTS